MLSADQGQVLNTQRTFCFPYAT
uniref:Uncharacterized protein n=1 Tax=Anguilla anguilla TaxID=7936 RepID=A0A0E9QNH7_ANGAN